MLTLDRLALRQGPRLLFEDASLQLARGQKLGLTGANGCGKSSLLDLVLGRLHADAGDYRVSSDWVVAHVAQEVQATNRAAVDYVVDGDDELRMVMEDLRSAEASADGEAMANCHMRLEEIGGYQARSRAARLLAGLSFSEEDLERPMSAFSGGWRMRLNLARALMSRSDLLLLDEPTNHLDLDAVIWLENWLRQYPGALILISHDRDFLDAIVDQVAHIERQALTLYSGNYSRFETLRAEKLAQDQSEYRKQQQAIQHMQAFVERFRAKATKAKQAQSRIKALERMTLIAPAHVDTPFHFEFREPDVLPQHLMKLDGVSAGYDGHAVLNKLDLTLLAGERIGLLGLNGAGKSTLIKLIAGELEPMTGRVEAARDLKIGYFAQHQLEQLDPAASPLLHLQRIDPKASERELRSFLGGFNFSGDRVLEVVAPFSGGEKARLVLALLIWQKPNLLLLDEPTNHLDLEMRLALNQALQAFGGSVILVSHDRHLLRSVCDDLMLVDRGRVEDFRRPIEDYPAWLAERRASGDIAPTRKQSATVSAGQQRKLDAEFRKSIQPRKSRLKRIERSMEKLRAVKDDIERQMADSGLYQEGQNERLRELIHDQAENRLQLEQLEEEWLEISEEIERQELAFYPD